MKSAGTPGSPPSIYRCPLCEEDFEREAALDGRLTIEHVPPRALGGRGLVLTCKPCNNRAGEFVDAAVAGRAEQGRVRAAMLANRGTWEGRAILHAWGERLAIDLSIYDEAAPPDAGDGTIRRILQVIPTSRSNDPAVLRRFRAAADAMLRHEQSALPAEYQITPQVGFYPARARLGDLRSAYLVAFAVFGYTYALSPRLRLVRDRLRAIRDPAAIRALLPGAAATGPEFYIDGDPPEPRSESAFGIARLRAPFAAVFVDLATVRVVLPALDGPDDPLAAMRDTRPALLPQHPSAGGGKDVFLLEATWLAWPTTLVAQLDLFETSA